MKSEKVRGWAFRLVGLALFAVVLSRIDLGHSLTLLRRADPVTLAAATLLIFPMMALKTARWRWLQRSAGLRDVSFTRSFLAYFAGMFAGLITPGRVGELVRVRYLTARGASIGPAFSTVLWDRVIDVAGLFLMGAAALWPLAGEFRALYVSVALVTLAGCLGIIALIWWGKRGAGRWGLSLQARLSRLGRIGRGAGSVLPGILESLSGLSFSAMFGMVTLTLAGWVVYYFQAWLLARTLEIELGLLPLVVCVTAAAVAAFLPVSISGLGTRDAAMVLLFGRFGHPGAEAMALSALIFLILVVNAVLGLAATQILEWRPQALRMNPD